MDKKIKGTVIVFVSVFFILLAVFAGYAGVDIGADIGEFVYNIKH